MNKARKQYIKECEVSELVKVNLGGYEQKILIEGKSKDLPVVIVLHGGPGSPVPFSVGCRGLFPEWTSKAVMVFWDQLGCGANNYKLDDSFKISNFIGMTCDLVNYIKSRFPQNKLYLFGVSWGSILTLNTVLRMPEKLDGAFVYGHVLKNLFFNDEVVSAFYGAPQSVKNDVQKIIQTGTDCEYKVLDKNLKTLYKHLKKYTNGYFNKNAEPLPIGLVVKGLLQSPDYSLRDFKAVVKNGYANNTSLWRELLKIDLSPLLSEIKIKYLIMQGDTDLVTSTATVLKETEACNNSNITVKIVKNSGHMPSTAAMTDCLNTLIKFVE